MKDKVTVREHGEKKTVQKQLMLVSMSEAYQNFKEVNPEIKVGLSNFHKFRPKNTVFAGASGTHVVCVCKQHEVSFDFIIIFMLESSFHFFQHFQKIIQCFLVICLVFGTSKPMVPKKFVFFNSFIII